MSTFEISIPGSESGGVPALRENFGRITVILGANGTGKSKTLRVLSRMKSAFGEARPLVFVEGGRVLTPPDSVSLDRNTFVEFQNIHQANANHRDLKHKELSKRVRHAFLLLNRLSDEQKAFHSDAVVKWNEAGMNGPVPLRGEPPLDRLFRLFHDVFPEIELHVEPTSMKITCRKNGSAYHPSALSDGERQVLAILADIAVLADERSLIVVDEPELNLNMQLASRLWDSIEAALPNAVFVYGTHALAFAMRTAVDEVIVLGGRGKTPIHVDNIGEIPSDELREFLGAIPAILAAPAAVAVKGRDSSVDVIFFQWVIGRSDAVVVPVGECSNVASAVRRTGIWERLAPSAKLAGVIDRDFRSNDDLASLRGAGCVTLKYHEIESYLSHPAVAVRVAEKLGTVEHQPSDSEIAQIIIDTLRSERLNVAARRTFARAEVRFAVSMSRQEMNSLNDENAYREAIGVAAAAEYSKVESRIRDQATIRMFDEELDRIDTACRHHDVENALALVPGKAICWRVASLVGCKGPIEMARAAAKHIELSEVPGLLELRTEILAALA